MAHENAPKYIEDIESNMPERFASTDSNVTYGITVVGEAQSGKSVMARKLFQAWGELYPHTTGLHFDTGIGFRRMAAEILYSRMDQDHPDEPVDAYFHHNVRRYWVFRDWRDKAHQVKRAYEFSNHYEDKLRTVAVDSAVPYVAEDHELRPELNKAAGYRLREIIRHPHIADLSERPSFVVIDGRNRGECNEILSIAGVALLGTLILTCPEDIAASRKVLNNPELDLLQEEQFLRERNIKDRGRGLGPTTLPKDIPEFIYADKLIELSDPEAWLAHAGRAMAADPGKRGIALRTDKMTLEDEGYIARSILKGMFRTALLSE